MAKAVVETGDRRIYGAFGWAQVGLIGAMLGAASYVLALLLGRYIIDPLVCGGDSLAACGQSEAMAGNFAAIIAAIVGAGLLIRLHIHRAIGVALAVLVSFWGLRAITAELAWFETIVWFAVLYALGYVLFTNVFRIRLLAMAVIVTVVAAVVLRWVAFL